MDLPDVFAMEKVLHIASLTCQMPSSLPTVAQKAGMEQKKTIRTTLIKALGKATLASAQANSVDALGKKFEDILNLYLESTTTEAFHTVLKEREASIASHCGRS